MASVVDRIGMENIAEKLNCYDPTFLLIHLGRSQPSIKRKEAQEEETLTKLVSSPNIRGPNIENMGKESNLSTINEIYSRLSDFS